MPTLEDQAREHIDQALEQAGWKVQDYKSANLHTGRGVVLRNFPLVSGHGFADYLLYVDGKAAGIIEAKKEGVTLIGVEVQAEKYSKGLPTDLPASIRPLPFSIKAPAWKRDSQTASTPNLAAARCSVSIDPRRWPL